MSARRYLSISEDQWILARLRPDGTPDGAWFAPKRYSSSPIRSIAIAGNPILLTGEAKPAEGSDHRWQTHLLWRSPRTLDRTVRSNPGAGTGPGIDDVLPKAVADGTHFYLVGTQSLSTAERRLRIEKRRLIDGSLEDSLDSPISHPIDIGCALDGDSLFISGGDGIRSLVRWYRADTGTLDSGFGSGGEGAADWSGMSDFATSLGVDHDALYVGGDEGSMRIRVDKRHR